METSPLFHFPTDLKFTFSPMKEAWLIIKWKLEAAPNNQTFLRDELFPVALGRFDYEVKENYKFRAELPASQAPLEITPYIPRFQFRKDGPGTWPLLQIGPGIATVNFQPPCPWATFKIEALYLRKTLIKAYSEKKLEIDTLSLTYRNAIEFDYSNSNILDLLSKKLNTKIAVSKHLPGAIAQNPNIQNMSFLCSYSLKQPTNSIGQLRISTGTIKEKAEEVKYVVFDTEITSKENLPDISNETLFKDWLEQSHSVSHEWFMSLIEGTLFKEYTKEKREEEIA